MIAWMKHRFQTGLAIFAALVVCTVSSAHGNTCPDPVDPARDADAAYAAAACQLEAASTRDQKLSAFEHIHAAAKAGSAAAMTRLGGLYDGGTYLEKDPSMAAFWFLRGARAGDPQAQVQIGLRYILGLAVNPDPVRGYAWVVLADRAGNERARSVRAKLDERFTDAERSEGTALADTLLR